MMIGVAPRVADAFETGGGVPFEDYGEDGVLAIDLMTRGLYEQRFADYWLKAMPEVHAPATVFRARTSAATVEWGATACTIR